MYSLILVDPGTNAVVYDASQDAQHVEIGTASCSFTVDLQTTPRAQAHLGETRLLHLHVGTPQTLRIYRADPPRLDNGMVTWTGVDPLVALDDIHDYTALWSSEDYSAWKQTTLQDRSGRAEAGWTWDTGDMLRIGLKQGATYGSSNTGFGGLHIRIPDGSSRQIVAIQLDVAYALPSAGFLWGLTRYSANWGSGVTDAPFYFVGNASTTPITRRGIYVLGAPADIVEFGLYYNSASSGQNLAQDSVYYIKATNVRVVTSTTRMTNTTLASATLIGATTITVAPGTAVNAYAGQRIYVGGPFSGACEAATIASIAGNVITLTAGLVNAHASGENVMGLRITDDQIVADVLAQSRILNPWSLNSDTFLIAQGDGDMRETLYENQPGLSVVRSLEAAHGIATTVDRDSLRVRYRRVPAGLTWVVDDADITIRSTLQDVVTRVRVAAENAAGRTVRGAYAIATKDEARNVFARTATYVMPTDTLTNPEAFQQAFLADRSRPQRQIDIHIRAVSFLAGGKASPSHIQEGDTIIIPWTNWGLSAETPILFTVAERTYMPETDTIQIVPRAPLPAIERLLAQTLAR